MGSTDICIVLPSCSSCPLLAPILHFFCPPTQPSWFAPRPPLRDIPSGCRFFTGPWTVTRSSLRMLAPPPPPAPSFGSSSCIGAVCLRNHPHMLRCQAYATRRTPATVLRLCLRRWSSDEALAQLRGRPRPHFAATLGSERGRMNGLGCGERHRPHRHTARKVPFQRRRA